MPFSAPATASLNNPPTCRPFPRVHQMMPGRLFHPVNDPNRVFALLSNEQLGVMDGARVWCVVIATNDRVADVPGMLIALPRDAQVECLHVVSAMQLAGEH